MTLDRETAGRLYQDAFQTLKVHELLLRDEARNWAFYRALQAVVTPSSRVLDIGSGSGLWAIIAARLGAQKVVAIEREPLLIGLIKALALDLGVSDRVEVIFGDSRQVQLDREFDVIVSETIGHVVFDEEIVPIMVDARERFLKPGGRLIPETVALTATPAHFAMGSLKLPAGIPEEFSYFKSLARHMPVILTDKRHVQIAGETRVLVQVDLHTVTVASLQDLTKLNVTWTVAEGAPAIDCMVVWAEVGLGDGIIVKTIDTSSWTATVYRLKPFAGTRGELRFDLALETLTNRWTVSLANGETLESQSYSPAIAAVELLAQTRMEPAQFRQMKQAGNLGLEIL